MGGAESQRYVSSLPERGIYSHLQLCMEPKAEKVRRAAVAVIARVRDALISEGEVRLLHDRQAVKDFEDPLRRVIQVPVAEEETQPAGGEIIAVRTRKPVDVSRYTDGVFGTTPSAPFNERTRRERTINLREHESLGFSVAPACADVRADIFADLDLCTDSEPLLELDPAHRRYIRRSRRSSAQSDCVSVIARVNAIAEHQHARDGRLAGKLVRQFELGDIAIAPDDAVFQAQPVRLHRHEETPGAHLEARRNVFSGDSPRVAARISRKIPRSECERRPIHELGARIVAVFQHVEDV